MKNVCNLAKARTRKGGECVVGVSGEINFQKENAGLLNPCFFGTWPISKLHRIRGLQLFSEEFPFDDFSGNLNIFSH